MFDALKNTLTQLIALLQKKQAEDSAAAPVADPSTWSQHDTLIVPKTKREELYDFAFQCFNEKRHCTLDDTVDKALGCAEAVSYILKNAGVIGIPAKGIAGTVSLYEHIKADVQFVAVAEPMFGDIIISPSYPGHALAHGHTGIVGKYQIMSNNSLTGIWDNHWVLKDWLKYYTQEGGLPTYYLRRLG